MLRPALPAWVVLAVLLLGLSPAGPRAQPRDDDAASRAYRSVAQSCAPEYRRLCAAPNAADPQPRAVAICLRPYKTSLSLGCRRAISALPR